MKLLECRNNSIFEGNFTQLPMKPKITAQRGHEIIDLLSNVTKNFLNKVKHWQ